METLELVEPLGWKWKNAGFLGKEYELLAAGQPVALLKFRSLFSTHAELSFQDQSWTFERSGIFSSRIILHRIGITTENVIFSPSHNLLALSEVGELVFDTGLSLSLRRSGFIQNIWHVDSSGEELLDLKITGALRTDAEVYPRAALAGLPNALLVLGFTFYLALVHLMDDSSGG